jgi:hypothetical protein
MKSIAIPPVKKSGLTTFGQSSDCPVSLTKIPARVAAATAVATTTVVVTLLLLDPEPPNAEPPTPELTPAATIFPVATEETAFCALETAIIFAMASTL